MFKNLKKLKELPLRRKIIVCLVYVVFYILTITVAPNVTAVILAFGPLVVPVAWLFWKERKMDKCDSDKEQ